MAKQSLTYQSKIFLIFIVLVGFCYSFSTVTTSQADCTQPKIVQYLKNYVMPTNDLQTLIKQNISTLTLESIKSKNVTFSQVKCQLTYLGGKSISPLSPFQYTIANDAFSVKMTWSANVSKLVGHDSFNITGQIASIKVGYIKTYSLQKKKFQITNLTYAFTSDMIVEKSITPTPKDSQKTQIQAVIKSDLFNSFNTQLKSLQPWLNDIAGKQRISQVFQTDKYNYDYYGWTLAINTEQLLIQLNGSNIINGYRGDIQGTTSQCPAGIPDMHPQYNMFIGMPFIQNFAKTVVQRYTPYKNIKIDSSWVRTQNFQFRLVDLQYVLSGQYETYGKDFMKPISFTCSIKQLVSGYIANNNLVEILKWSCAGYLWTSNTTSVQILDSLLTVSHEIQIRLNNGQTLSAYANVIKVVDAVFNPVGSITVKNPELARVYMEDFLNDMRVYLPGTFFKIIKNSKNIQLVNDEADNKGTGIWTG